MAIHPRISKIDQWLLRRIFQIIGPAPIQLVLHGGNPVSPPGITSLATVSIRDRRTLAGLMFDPEMAFSEAYAEGRIEVHGDLVRALEQIYASWNSAPIAKSRYARATSRWLEWRQRNTVHQSRENIHHHYDLGNDFYQLWLDRELVYTCAYFPESASTLEQAQKAKLDYVCRKVRLQPGETVVDAGCGWGALALHMARHYGVSVKAFNVSHEQILFARKRAAEGQLSHQVEFIEDDYRNISGRFDAFVSIGMLEHLGADHYSDLGRVIHRTIGDAGRGLLHFIGRNRPADFSRWIRKRIFPGAYAPSLREALTIFEPWNYAVLDVENLRPHYPRTLEHWLDRFEKSYQQVVAMYDPWFARAWRLYLAGSIAAFRTGTLQLFQIVFAGSKSQPITWTRAPLYTDSKPERQETECIPAMS